MTEHRQDYSPVVSSLNTYKIYLIGEQLRSDKRGWGGVRVRRRGDLYSVYISKSVGFVMRWHEFGANFCDQCLPLRSYFALNEMEVTKLSACTHIRQLFVISIESQILRDTLFRRLFLVFKPTTRRIEFFTIRTIPSYMLKNNNI